MQPTCSSCGYQAFFLNQPSAMPVPEPAPVQTGSCSSCGGGGAVPYSYGAYSGARQIGFGYTSFWNPGSYPYPYYPYQSGFVNPYQYNYLYGGYGCGGCGGCNSCGYGNFF